MIFRFTLNRRDAVLLLLGATLLHIFTLFVPTTSSDDSLVINTYLQHINDLETDRETITEYKTIIRAPARVSLQDTDADVDLPQTSFVHHAPGWTLFRDLYMSDGTLFILSDNRSKFPEIRLMTSTGLPAVNTPENIASREPTEKDMDFVTPEQAKTRWGYMEKRVLTVHGNTVLVNEPGQFLNHYYHLVAELFFGIQAFWHGFFSTPSLSNSESANTQLTHPAPPPLDRIIFAHASANGWRDAPGFNSYFIRSAFPSLTVEHLEDWNDRIAATSSSSIDRAFHFPLVLLTDRSASHRGVICGSQTQRIAAEAWEYMRQQHLLMGIPVGGWWEPVRASVLRFAGVDSDVGHGNKHTFEMPDKVVITYISRQGTARRKLTVEAHASLVAALTELCDSKPGWEMNVMEAETMTKDAQVAAAARTTVMVGVHGNGLSHLLWMSPTKVATVVEIFYPGGFARDYHWTTRALGMAHVVVWNDTFFTYPNDNLRVDYPEGFQDNYIPVHGPTVARIIEDRVEGRL